MAGRGSVEKRGEGSWRLRYSGGFDQKGKRIRKSKTVTAKNITEARKKLAEFVTEIEVGEYIDPSKIKFADFVNEWREKHGKKHLGQKTLEVYDGHINSRILPTFGHLRIDKVKTMQIVDFLDELTYDGVRLDGKEGGLSMTTVEYIHRILKDIFARAVEWKIIKESPVAGVAKPKREESESEIYDIDEIKQLFKSLKNEPLMWRIMILMAVLTGARREELLGLEWQNVDLEEGGIYVVQALIYAYGQHVLKDTKTKNSKRWISLDSHLVSELKTYKQQWDKEREEAGELWEGGEHNFVFTYWHGKPLHPSSVYHWWRKFIDRHELKYIKFHALRHTSATYLINDGENTKNVSSRLGHSETATTLDIYSHAIKRREKLASDRFGSLFDDDPKDK